MVFSNPKVKSIFDSQPNILFANSIDGCLCFGSSSGSFLYKNSKSGLTRAFIISASSLIESYSDVQENLDISDVLKKEKCFCSYS